MGAPLRPVGDGSGRSGITQRWEDMRGSRGGLAIGGASDIGNIAMMLFEQLFAKVFLA